MEFNEKINNLYNECIIELKNIGIDLINADIGEIYISITNRSKSRYACCKQELPEKTTKYYEKIGRKKYVKYGRFKKHTIQISRWVLDLDDKIIKNTIIHELIHCLPYCNNHKKLFNEYAEYINYKLGYNITRLGNKKEDYKKSNIEYNEVQEYKYKIECERCKQIFFRKRIAKNFLKKYRCGKCGGKFTIYKIGGGRNEKNKIK